MHIGANRIINQKDKRIHASEKENKKLKERLSGYQTPGKDSHNSSSPSPLRNPLRQKQSEGRFPAGEEPKSGGQPGHPGTTLETNS